MVFPIPLNQFPREKETKRLLFIDKSGFERLIKGEQLDDVIRSAEARTIPGAHGEKPWAASDIPRVGLSRFSNHPGDRFFYFGHVRYDDDAGLFFLIVFRDSSFRKRFMATMNVMADEGIGGDRTSGKGLFHAPQYAEISLEVPASEGVVALSPCLPAKDELKTVTHGYYRLMDRRGYVYSPECRSLRRKSVRMCCEGSVFDKRVNGRVEDVTPELFQAHRVMRYGLCFSVPISLRG